MEDGEPRRPGHHPLDDRLRVLEGYVIDLVDQVALIERRAEKLESELLSLTGRQVEIAEAIRSMVSARLRRDEERDEDMAVRRSLYWCAIWIALCTVAAHVVIASYWATGPLSWGFTWRALFPPPHSREFPRDSPPPPPPPGGRR